MVPVPIFKFIRRHTDVFFDTELTSALYTILLDRQWPSRRHWILFLQLQFFEDNVALDLFKICWLWDDVVLFTLGIQL